MQRVDLIHDLGAPVRVAIVVHAHLRIVPRKLACYVCQSAVGHVEVVHLAWEMPTKSARARACSVCRVATSCKAKEGRSPRRTALTSATSPEEETTRLSEGVSEMARERRTFHVKAKGGHKELGKERVVQERARSHRYTCE